MVDDSNVNLPNITTPENSPFLSEIHITEEQVFDHLSTLDISKASGPEGVGARLLKSAARELSKPLAQLFSKSLQTSTFPDIWKIASVVPVFKNGVKDLIQKYRPISLLSNIGKSMERCVFKHLYNYLIESQLITCFQSGFRPGDSATNQLLHLTNIFGKAIDDGKEIRVMFFDIRRAFDIVWHAGFSHKLQKIGIRGPLLKWFKSYLSDWKQKATIGGCSSRLLNIRAGVPQDPYLVLCYFLFSSTI